jgi:hypothetical protein
MAIFFLIVIFFIASAFLILTPVDLNYALREKNALLMTYAGMHI